eukprot:scaffold2838_cov112-Cylindrotheca_fusiformis.AAC.6
MKFLECTYFKKKLGQLIAWPCRRQPTRWLEDTSSVEFLATEGKTNGTCWDDTTDRVRSCSPFCLVSGGVS